MVFPVANAGLLKPGGTVVEGTAGNTGIGLAHICNARGYKCIIYMPNTQSPEKIETLENLGAEVRPVPAVPITDPNHYNQQARICAEGLSNGAWLQPPDVPPTPAPNPRSHTQCPAIPSLGAQRCGRTSSTTRTTGWRTWR